MIRAKLNLKNLTLKFYPKINKHENIRQNTQQCNCKTKTVKQLLSFNTTYLYE